MNAQQIFDKVAAHLLTQGKKAMVSTDQAAACMYRGPNGTRCAVGCLIPDELYHEDFEYHTAKELPESLWTALEIDMPAHEELVMALQMVHDNALPETWAKRLHALAEAEHLNADVIKELRP